ncbi:MAG: hypothetical protein AAGF15_00510 [Pseudomonadota bacterium]
MDMGIWFWVIVVGIPVFMGVSSEMWSKWLKHKEKEMALREKTAGVPMTETLARLERVEQRLQVLERIMTDKSGRLADEIDSLRDRPLN